MRAIGVIVSCCVLVCTCVAVSGNPVLSENVTHRLLPVDLYRIWIESQADADAANMIAVNALMPVDGGYLVLADRLQANVLMDAGIPVELIAEDINLKELAIDIRADGQNIDRYPIIWDAQGIRIFRIGRDQVEDAKQFGGLAPIPARNLDIEYRSAFPAQSHLKSAAVGADLDSLVSCVSRDSLESYSYALQSYINRTAGSIASRACKNWLMEKFLEFGYDSIVIDPFIEESWWGDLISGENVIAYKIGSLYPYDQIIIGAHRDVVPGSPGADDNGSGVAAVMEMARILKDIETNLTIIFILFDAEENGLLGSESYARRAAERGDRIAFMLNLDMIAFYRNSNDAYLYHGPNTEYAELWVRLADSLAGIGITGRLNGPSGGSDHAPFVSYGYDAVFVHEYFFSSVYHSPQDSTTYLDFEYMTRMTMASLATAYYTDVTYIPDPTLIIVPMCEFSPIIYPGSEVTVTVRILEYAGGVLIPGSVALVYSVNEGPITSIPMTLNGGDLYEVDLPAISCLDRISYSVAAGEQSTNRIISYPKISEPLEAIKATAIYVLLDDDFETEHGWTVEGNAADGHWERWRAAGNAAEPTLDYDGSGKCYLTDHNNFSDVDNGTTTLISPELEITHGEAFVEYARWYANDLGGAAYQDEFKVYFYHGEQLIPVETVGPLQQASGGWYFRCYRVTDFFEAVEPVRLRFDASDLIYDSGVEAAVDAVKVYLYSDAPYIITDMLPDGTVDTPYSMQLGAVACAGPVMWTDKHDDLGGTGLTLTSDGVVTGMVSDTGIVTFTAAAEDAAGIVSEQEYQVHFWVPFLCGDANRDGIISVADPAFIINYIFKNGPEPYPLDVADANADGDVDIGDAVALIAYIFKGGDPPQCK